MTRTELRIPLTAIGPALARAAIPTVLPPASASATVVADIQLLVSELVSDAVRAHPSSPAGDVRVTVETSPGWLRIEVANAQGARQPSPGTWPALLLDRLATRWGCEGDDARSRVWFDIAFR